MNSQNLCLSIASAARALDDRKEEVNRLNVFPVPDGDTGTNMSLTLESVVTEIKALPVDADVPAICHAITHGSLMGARGNSGVITSQILRGLCESFSEAKDFDTQAIADAFGRAVEISFQAVRKPVEGTILTVVEDMSKVATDSAAQGMDVEETLKAIAAESLASAKRTPELLPVLKENGVVDSGGFGLAVLTQSFVSAFTGEEMELPEASEFSRPEPKVAIEQVNDWAGSDYMYCTEFLLSSEDIDVDETKKFLGGIGDCELLVGTHPDFKVHVHTDTPGEVLNYMTERGQVAEVFIHNMILESQERAEGIAAGEGEAEAEEESSERKPLGIVAVASGSGTATILRSLGVDYVVSGGQTMNPSTKDLLEAVEKVNADSVIILPNNKNILMSAQSAAECCEDAEVGVVPTTNVPASFSALFAVDFDASLADNVEAMTAVLDDVHYGEVTTAIKKAKTEDGQKIKAGDVIGIADGSLDFVGDDIIEVAMQLIEEIDDDYDTLTLLAGEDFSDSDMDTLVGRVEEEFDNLEIDAQRGEQPLYPLVFSLE
ncbi:MAG: DAK2 domain-containing protein [Coriobacteriaceae bacterium]|nr:DAK2 domain-containing protein [Coriobacteriaceae bacterium]